jgi:hypothetical protein
MAARGGRGGRGRGGKPSPFTPQLMAGLNYNDIIKQSKEGHVHYPVGSPRDAARGCELIEPVLLRAGEAAP